MSARNRRIASTNKTPTKAQREVVAGPPARLPNAKKIFYRPGFSIVYIPRGFYGALGGRLTAYHRTSFKIPSTLCRSGRCRIRAGYDTRVCRIAERMGGSSIMRPNLRAPWQRMATRFVVRGRPTGRWRNSIGHEIHRRERTTAKSASKSNRVEKLWPRPYKGGPTIRISQWLMPLKFIASISAMIE